MPRSMRTKQKLERDNRMKRRFKHKSVFEIAGLLVGAKMVLKELNDEKITQKDIDELNEQLKLLEKLATFDKKIKRRKK